MLLLIAVKKLIQWGEVCGRISEYYGTIVRCYHKLHRATKDDKYICMRKHKKWKLKWALSSYEYHFSKAIVLLKDNTIGFALNNNF